MYIICIAIPDTGLLTITDPQLTDSGTYTCRAKANHSDYDEINVNINKRKIIIHYQKHVIIILYKIIIIRQLQTLTALNECRLTIVHFSAI